jgi:pyrimidine operon attenuation protein / uracil phosphoribosyltransferase
MGSSRPPADGGRVTTVPRTRRNMMLKEKAEIVDADGLRRIVTRIAHEIVERNKGVDDLVLVGIKRRGVPLAERLAARIAEFEGKPPSKGSLDITLYRDDLSTVSHQPVVGSSDIPVDIRGKVVVLVDDVLYTGRTVRAAMDALVEHGRPRAIQLAVLIDRGHRELPIRPDFVGRNIPTQRSEIICVEVGDTPGDDRAYITERNGQHAVPAGQGCA